MLADAWSKMARSPSTTTADVTASIEEALEIVEQLRARGDEVEVLVTGSLHLIGGVMVRVLFAFEMHTHSRIGGSWSACRLKVTRRLLEPVFHRLRGLLVGFSNSPLLVS